MRALISLTLLAVGLLGWRVVIHICHRGLGPSKRTWYGGGKGISLSQASGRENPAEPWRLRGIQHDCTPLPEIIRCYKTSYSRFHLTYSAFYLVRDIETTRENQSNVQIIYSMSENSQNPRDQDSVMTNHQSKSHKIFDVSLDKLKNERKNITFLI